MTFEEAVRNSIRQYYKGFSPEASLGTDEQSTQYTPEYFNDVENEMFGEVEAEEGQEVTKDA